MFDAFAIDIAPAGVLMRDPTVTVHSLSRTFASPPGDALSLSASVRVSLMPLSNDSVSGLLAARINGSTFSSQVDIPPGTIGQWVECTTDIVNLTRVELWWPHTHGNPRLYDAVISFTPASGHGSVDVRWRAGFRTISSAVDVGMGGQVFSINGERVFLQGGNYITSDILNRALFRTPERYWDEVR